MITKQRRKIYTSTLNWVYSNRSSHFAGVTFGRIDTIKRPLLVQNLNKHRDFLSHIALVICLCSSVLCDFLTRLLPLDFFLLTKKHSNFVQFDCYWIPSHYKETAEMMKNGLTIAKLSWLIDVSMKFDSGMLEGRLLQRNNEKWKRLNLPKCSFLSSSLFFTSILFRV